MDHYPIFRDLVILYGFGMLVVYLFQRLNQSPIVGFLIAGVLLGPGGFSLIESGDSVKTLAEIGVMLLLFSLGLEFSLRKLTQMRYVILGTGPAQVVGTILVTLLIAATLELPFKLGLFLGFVVSLSSTAIIIRMLVEKGEQDSTHGRVSLGVLIFQDFCVVPMIVVIPLLAEEGSILVPLSLALLKAAVVIFVVVLVARYVFPTLLDRIVRTRSKELFVITSIFIFLGTAWATSMAGFSLALGAFLAGLVLSESEYNHQIFAEVRPFRDSLNSLFFISIGMLVEPAFIWENLMVVLGVGAAILAGKALLTAGSVFLTGFPLRVAVLSALPMSQIGEFSFILLEAGDASGLVPYRWYQILIAAAVATMLLTPALFWFSRTLVSRTPRFNWGVAWRQKPVMEDLAGGAETLTNHVIICGFGVSGRNIARVLKGNEIPYLILELNAQTVERERKQGEPVYFGDCTDSEVLIRAGIKEAKAIVLAVSDPFSTRRAIQVARNLNPEAAILSRSKYLAELDEIYQLGATEVVSEEFEASLELVRVLLRIYNFPPDLVAEELKRIRLQKYELFRSPHQPQSAAVLDDLLAETTGIFPVSSQSKLCFRKIRESGLRESTGVIILRINRDSESIYNPGPDDVIQPGDRLLLTGTRQQMEEAARQLSPG